MKEYKFPKNFWKLIITSTAKTKLSSNFIDLVQSAYAKTPQGSFVNTVNDVTPSEWIAYDWDKDPEADSVIFFRKPRSNETWKGFKIQGIGHDTQRISIDKVMTKVKRLLMKPGWWIEASDAMEHILYKDKNIPYVTNQYFANDLFPNSKLRMLGDPNKPGKYKRIVGGHEIKETIFGHPKLK